MSTRPVVLGVAAVVALLATPGAPARAGDGPTCFGEEATIVGPRPDPGTITRVVGTPGPDVIFSRWDDQLIDGRGGDDLLCGHAGIRGGPGDDRMRVRREQAFLDASTLYGGSGDDTIHRDEPLDDDPHFANLTYGGAGRDRLFGSPNLDELVGGPGRDLVLGGGLADTITGGRGPDVLVGQSGNDEVRGNAGDDRLRGEERHDRLRGGPGDDLVRGGTGDDLIWGGDGVDVAVGGPDVDTCREAEDADCELP